MPRKLAISMRARPNPVEALATLIRVEDSNQRRANWRQAIAALGQRTGFGLTAAPPLEGIAQEVIARAAEVAIEVGLADDLDWLAPGPATVALYEITAALPPGKTRRELGRRVFARLYEGNASTFAAVAARMALTSGRPFETATLRARVGLLFDLPVGTPVNADPLALTLVTRRELRERWIDAHRTGTLPARRLAAKLIEHAAREAVFRAQQGDVHPRDLLGSEPVRGAYQALLADREPLVWRHVAVARGLLAAVDPALRQEIELSLDPALSPTEWRRGAVSMVALSASDPEQAIRACRTLMSGPIAELDKGIAATLVLGLPRVIEAQPEAAQELFEHLAMTGRPDVAEAAALLLGDVKPGVFTCRSAGALCDLLGTRADAPGSPLRELAERARKRLSQAEDETDVVGLVRRSLEAYESRGARPAFELAERAAAALGRAMDFVSISDAHQEQTLAHVLSTLSDIDIAALERPRLRELLLLSRRPGETDAGVPELDQLYDRLGRWILHAEANAPAASSVTSALGGQHRLRTLLHLMDADSTRNEDDKKVRTRVSSSIRLLLPRVASGSSSPAQRIACAALARAFDAAVRENLAEPADLLLSLCVCVQDAPTYRTLAEASTNPDVRGVLTAYAEFLRSDPHESIEPLNEITHSGGKLSASEEAARVAARVVRLSRGLGAGGSYRGEALRRIVLRVGRALEAIAGARGQDELVDSTGGGPENLGELEGALDDLHRLARGAVRRLIGEDPLDIPLVTDTPSLAALVERAARAFVPPDPDQLEMAIRELTADLPPAIGAAVALVLARLTTLPVAAPSDVFAIPLERRRVQLPEWLLPHRTIGAFYVVRALGSGGASSVFLARRLEERNSPRAEGFALKVPDYDPTTARSLSEQDFLQLFREEAGALLSLPKHDNLARFVTFDTGARPKPILVMELIRGASLDRLIRTRSLSVERAFSYLDGILAALSAMHECGVAHLDVKPSNIILQNGEIPVLVDFGLSGRHLRPGCGTLDYSAPEVLGNAPVDWESTPLPTDIYAFACTAFEALTANTLFDGDDETEVLNAHLIHDGWPERLARYGHAAETVDLAKLLAACLRCDPRHRPTAVQARQALQRIAPALIEEDWPLEPRCSARMTASPSRVSDAIVL